MNQPQVKILVVYASEAGSTAEVATYIKKQIEEEKYEVVLSNVKEVDSVNDYDIIFVGSPIYVGKWKKEATKFIETNQEILKSKQVFYFLTCMNLATDDHEKLAQVPKFLEYERSLVESVSEGRFAGVINMKKLSFFKRLMIKMVKAPEGDFRNWEEIANWTNQSLKLIKDK
ncbi:flavodoxin domain-containing protein [bacterium]|nr:flavodoxin domain-containing protein [bacterium]